MEEQIYITIAKVLQGEASPAEQRELDAWLAADAGNADIFDDMKRVWAEADTVLETPEFNTTLAWEKVSASIHQAPAEIIAQKSRRSIVFPAWVGHSAAIAAILVIALFVWNPFSKNTVRIAAKDANERIELPDHSIITLRKGSTFSYPKKFAARERKVVLEGEAFFEVAHNEQQPFVVEAQSVSVKVMGTTFNVRCSGSAADVTVATGRVQVSASAAAGRTVLLTPGNKAHYESGMFTRQTAVGYESSWKDDVLSFNGEPFSKVIAAIAAAKDTAIAIDAGLSAVQQQQAITVSFRRESLENMLTELCLITRCRWEKQGATYLVRTK